MKGILITALILYMMSCKKETTRVQEPPPPPPHHHPNNKVGADIHVLGAEFLFLAKGDSTDYKKTDWNFDARNVDSVAVITGKMFRTNGDQEKGITLFLTNILDTGMYIFGRIDSGKKIEIVYEEWPICPGFCIGPTYLASSDQSAGILFVDSFSATHISGRFSVTGTPVYYVDETDRAELYNGNFYIDFD